MSQGEGAETPLSGPSPEAEHADGFEEVVEEDGPPLSAAAQPILLLFLLFVATLGFYLPVIAYRVSRVVRPARSPWWWAVGSLVPLANLFVVFRLAEAVSERANRVRIASAVGPGIVLGVVIVTSVATMAWQKSDDFVMQLAGAAVRAVPWLLVQRVINRAAKREGAPAPRRRFRWLRRLVVASVFAFDALAIWGSRAVWHRAAGRSLMPGERVKGVTAGFSVATPGPSWVRVKPGSLGVGETDLELFGPSVDATVVAFVYDRENQSLDGRVDERRRLILKETKGEPTISEERHFIAGQAMVPMSLARYSSSQGGEAWWVATIDRGSRFVELVAVAPRGSELERQAERLLRSVLIEEGGP